MRTHTMVLFWHLCGSHDNCCWMIYVCCCCCCCFCCFRCCFCGDLLSYYVAIRICIKDINFNLRMLFTRGLSCQFQISVKLKLFYKMKKYWHNIFCFFILWNEAKKLKKGYSDNIFFPFENIPKVKLFRDQHNIIAKFLLFYLTCFFK